MTIIAMRREQQNIHEQIQALAKIEAAGTELSAEQITQFSDLETQFDEIGAKIKRAEKAEQLNAEYSTEVGSELEASPAPSAASSVVVTAVAQPEIKGAKVAKMVRALALTKGDPRAAANHADTVFKDKDVAMALGTGTPSGGGVLVPQAFMPDLIDMLRPKSVVRSMGALVAPLVDGQLQQPSIAGGAAVTYGSENTDMAASEPTFGELKLSGKKLTAMVPVSNEAMKYNGTSTALDQIIVNDITLGMGTREDQGFIRDDGTGDLPKGMRHWALAPNVFAAAGTAGDIQSIEQDLRSLITRLLLSNVRMLVPGFIMSPRTYVYLESLRTSTGAKAFPELADMKLKGYPVAFTTNVPVNLGGGGNETEIYLADFIDAVIAEEEGYEIAISSEAAYVEGGTLTSAFSKDQTVVRVVSRHDFGMRNAKSVAVLTGVNWDL